MSTPPKRDIMIRYIGVERPQISSIRSSKEIARSIFYDYWDDHHLGPEPEFIDVTVDGEVFTSLEDTL